MNVMETTTFMVNRGTEYQPSFSVYFLDLYAVQIEGKEDFFYRDWLGM